jgi:hypothetical protein
MATRSIDGTLETLTAGAAHERFRVRRLAAGLQFWCLAAVIALGAAVPWYTLRVVRLMPAMQGYVNPLDILVALAVAVALPRIVHDLWSRPRLVVPIWAFVAFSVVLLAISLPDPAARFLAVREARALVFYALGLAFIGGRYRTDQYRLLATLYAIGTVAAIVAVFAHFAVGMPLPGFEEPPGLPTNFRVFTNLGFGLVYLEWTTVVVSFVFSMAALASGAGMPSRVGWIAVLLATTWYVLVTGERFLEVVSAIVFVAVVALTALGRAKNARVALGGAAVLVAIVLGIGMATGVPWVKGPGDTVLYRWSRIFHDNSLAWRQKEFAAAIDRTRQHPLVGEGLGGVVLSSNPWESLPWRYIASGYGYLLVKMGLIGTFLWLAMVWTALQGGWRRMRSESRFGANEWPIGSVTMVGLGGLLLLNVIHPVVDIPEGAIAFSLFFGMAAASNGPEAQRPMR